MTSARCPHAPLRFGCLSVCMWYSQPAKSKKERMQKRQELLEKEEEAKLQQKDGESSDASKDGSALAGGSKAPVNPAAARPPKKLTFIEREKAKIHLQIQKARAIARKRIPFQVRILTQVRIRYRQVRPPSRILRPELTFVCLHRRRVNTSRRWRNTLRAAASKPRSPTSSGRR